MESRLTMLPLDVIGEKLSRDEKFLEEAKRMVKGVKTGVFWAMKSPKEIPTLDAVDIIKFALSFAWENGKLD